MYQVELVWNREFRFVPFGKEHEDLEKAKEFAKETLYMGDGARVKKTQVIDLDTGEVLAKY
jgi:hypothetical protein